MPWRAEGEPSRPRLLMASVAMLLAIGFALTLTIFYPGVSIYHIHERGSYKKLLPFLFHLKSAVTYFNKWGWFNDPEREYINRITLSRLTR